MAHYPVNLDVRQRRCVIVGGGAVAARKAASLLECQARVVVVSPQLIDSLRLLAEEQRLSWLARGYVPGDLAGAFLVFAATDNRQVQQQVIAEARQHNILINVADAPEACSFQVPATIRQGELLLTVATGGASPALAAALKKELESAFGPEYALLVHLLALVRKEVVGDSDSQQAHKLLFEKILQMNILSRIRNEEWDLLQQELGSVLPPQVASAPLVTALRAYMPRIKKR